jgi:drug/metabolite transporter (DMT)-like permease
VMQLNVNNVLSLIYVAVFPSTLAYLCFNRGVQLIGANRAAPFFHVVPVFGTALSIIFLGEHPQLFHFIGFALVLSGVFVASRKPKPAEGVDETERMTCNPSAAGLRYFQMQRNVGSYRMFS